MKQLIKKHLSGIWYVIITTFFIVTAYICWWKFHASPMVIIYIGALFMTLLYIRFRLLLVSPLKELSAEIDSFSEGVNIHDEIHIDTYHYDIERILAFFNASLKALNSIKKDFMVGKQLQSDVEFAAQIQSNILSQSAIETGGLHCNVRTKSADKVNGDTYGVIEKNKQHYIYLGDVTGHGVASGFVMMMVNALMETLSDTFVSSDSLLAELNKIITPRIPRFMMMTLVLLRWDEVQNKMYYTGAGHEHIIIYHPRDGTYDVIRCGGIALGMREGISDKLIEKEIDFSLGDILILYSDGITEIRSHSSGYKQQFGLDRLLNAIHGAPEKTGSGVFQNITTQLSSFIGYKPKQHDDMTLMCIEYPAHKQKKIPIIPKKTPGDTDSWSWE